MNTIEKNVPCWYELGWDKETKSLILRVHKDFAKETKIFPAHGVMIWSYKKEFGLSSCCFDFFGEHFGFDNAFKKRGGGGESIEYEIKIPNLETEAVCDFCSCAGKTFDEPCPICRGSKKKISYDFKPASAISASFTIFFNLAYFGRNMKIFSKKFQLFEIDTMTQRSSCGNGSAINGWFSEKLTTHLRGLQDSSLADIIWAMKIANSQMFNGRNSIFESLQFDASVGKKGRLILKCPGDASGVYPLSGDQRTEDYTFGSCNMDSPVQQITILAGLAALHDKARKAGI